MKKNVRFALLFAMLVVMLVMTAVFASAAAVDVGTAEEFTTAMANGGEINLTADIEIGSSIAITKDTTLTGTGTITYSGTGYLFVTSGTAAVTFDGIKATTATGGILQMLGSGAIEVTAATEFSITAGSGIIFNPRTSCTSTINVWGGTYTTTGGIWQVNNGNTYEFNAYIHDGTFTATGSVTGVNVNNDGHVVIYGGDFTHTGTGILLRTGDSQASIEVYGGTFTQNGTNYLMEKQNGSLLISKREGYDEPVFDQNADNVLLYVGNVTYSGKQTDYHVTITAGIFTGGISWIQSSCKETIHIKGGTFEQLISSTATSAGIRGLWLQNASYGGALNISGGSFTIEADRTNKSVQLINAAGAAVNISGGEFVSESTRAIVSMEDGDCVSTVTISGGSFTAGSGGIVVLKALAPTGAQRGDLTVTGGTFSCATGTAFYISQDNADVTIGEGEESEPLLVNASTVFYITNIQNKSTTDGVTTYTHSTGLSMTVTIGKGHYTGISSVIYAGFSDSVSTTNDPAVAPVVNIVDGTFASAASTGRIANVNNDVTYNISGGTFVVTGATADYTDNTKANYGMGGSSMFRISDGNAKMYITGGVFEMDGYGSIFGKNNGRIVIGKSVEGIVTGDPHFTVYDSVSVFRFNLDSASSTAINTEVYGGTFNVGAKEVEGESVYGTGSIFQMTCVQCAGVSTAEDTTDDKYATVSGTLTIAGGTFTAPASYAINNQGFSASKYNNITVNISGGTFERTDGSGSVLYLYGGKLNISGTATFYGYRNVWVQYCDVTIDGGSFNVTRAWEQQNSYLIDLGVDGDLVVNGGAFTSYGTLIRSSSSGTIEINGGEFTVNVFGSTPTTDDEIIYLYDGGRVVTVNGGTFAQYTNSAIFEQYNSQVIIPNDSTATFTAYGTGAIFQIAKSASGTFVNDVAGGSFVTNGGAAYATTTLSGNSFNGTVSITGGSFTVNGGSWIAASASGTFELSGGEITGPVTLSGTVALQLSGTASITGAVTAEAGSTLYLNGGSIVGNVVVSASAYLNKTAEGEASPITDVSVTGQFDFPYFVTIESGTFDGYHFVSAEGLMITGGTFTCTGGNAMFGVSSTGPYTVTITGGTFSMNATSDLGYMFRISDTTATVDVQGGEFIVGGKGCVFGKNNGVLQVSGGTFTASDDANIFRFMLDRNNVSVNTTVSDGVFTHTGTGDIFCFATNDSGNATNGALTVSGGSYNHSGAGYVFHVMAGAVTVDMSATSVAEYKSLILAEGGALTLQGVYSTTGYSLVRAEGGSVTVNKAEDCVITTSHPIIELVNVNLTVGGKYEEAVAVALVAEGESIVSGADAIIVRNGASVPAINVTGGMVTISGSWSVTHNVSGSVVYMSDGAVTVDGATISSAASGVSNAFVFDIRKGTLHISSGTFDGSGASAIIYNAGKGVASVQITGGSFVGGQAWIRTYGAAQFEISGDPQFSGNTADAAIHFHNASGSYGGSVTISGGTFTTSKVLFNCAGGALHIEDGQFISNGSACMFNMSDGDYVSDVKVSGGTFETTDTGTLVFRFDSVNKNDNSAPDGSITIQGGYFTSAGGTVIDFTPKGPNAFLKIEGGTFVQQGTGLILTCRNNGRYAAGITLADGTKVGCHITGGIFRAENSTLINAAGTTICIDKGTFIAGGTALVSMVDNDVLSTVIINGGSFTATNNCHLFNYAPESYSKRNTVGSATNALNGGCITRPLTINGGTFTAETGYVLRLNSVKMKSDCDVTINGGTFSGAGASLIYVSSPSVTTTLTITGGTFKLLDSDKGGAILSTGFYTRTDDTLHYDAPNTVHLPTKASITIIGGLFVDQRTGNNQVIDVSVGEASIDIKNAVLLTHERQAYFYLTADAETSAAVTMRAPTCLYGGANYYMWMTTPVTDATMAPVLDDGAGVRTKTDSEGIRFTSTVSPAAVALLEAKAKELGVTVEYGTLIAPADYVAAAGAFTLAALNDYVASHADVFDGDTTRVYVNIPAIKSLEGDATTGVSFSGALIDLKTTNYTRVLAAVSYAKVGNNYYYGSYDPIVNARSMAEVAEAALKDVGALGATNDKGRIYAHASVYITYNTAVGSVYSEAVQQVLQGYCGLAALTAETVSPSQFAMVYDTGAAAMVKDYVQLLANSLGITSINGATTDKEVLIGETGRTETATAKAKIRGEGYYVGVINGKIVLVGTSDALTYKALLAFAKRCGAASFTLAESIVSDVTVYDAKNLYFVFANERDGNIADGYEWGYTHTQDENGNDIPGYSVGFENEAYKSEINYYAVDYPVKAAVDVYCALHGLDASVYQNHASCKQSIVVPDSIASAGLRVHMGITDGAIVQGLISQLSENHAAAAVNHYGYRIENGEISIFAYNDTLLRKAVALFVADLENFSDGNGGYAIPATLSYTKTEEATTAWITDAPMPDLDLDGSVYLHNNTYQYHYTGEGVDLAAFQTYCAKLVSGGYSLYMQNDNVEGSYFRTYVNSDKTRMIHVIYAAFAHAEEQMIEEAKLSTMFAPALRVIVADVDGTNVNLLPTEWVNGTKSYTKLTDTMITSLNIDTENIGNCYIITLEDGSFVVMDGGGGGDAAADAALLYDTLVALHTKVHGSAPSSSNPITIAAYYLSHGHNDHFVMFHTFAKTYVEAVFGKYDGKKDYYVNMEAVIANFISDDEAYNTFDPNIVYGRNYLGTSDWYRNTTRSGSFLSYTTNYTPVPYYKVQTGQRFYVRNVEFEVLYTHGDTYPWGIEYFNNSSTILRTTIHNGGASGSTVSSVNTGTAGTTSVWTGDLQYRGSQVMRAMYGDYLKSDTMQISHHGGNGAEGALYELINASIVFLPSNFDRVNGNFTSASNVGVVNRTWLNNTDWEYIILHDEYNVTITVTADGPQMAESALQNFADSSDEYADDSEGGITVAYGRYVITRDTITNIWGTNVYTPPAA